MIYKVYEDLGQVVFEDSISRKNRYDFLDLSVQEVSTYFKITQVSTGKVIFNKAPFSNFVRKNGSSIGGSISEAKAYLDKVIRGSTERRFRLYGNNSSISYNGDVDYMTFPSYPYGTIENSLTPESVMIGNANDTVRGTNNTIDLRNLSSGATVSYKLSVIITNDQQATLSTESPTGQFESISETIVSGTNHLIELSGSSNVTNHPDWAMSLKLETAGSGSYVISAVEITVTK